MSFKEFLDEGYKIKWDKIPKEKMSKAMEEVDGIQSSIEKIVSNRIINNDIKNSLVLLSQQALKSGRPQELKKYIDSILEIDKEKNSLLRVLDIIR